MWLPKFKAFALAGFLGMVSSLILGCGAAPRSEAPPIQGDPVIDDSEPTPTDDVADGPSAKTYVGQVVNTLALVGIVAEGDSIIAYVCDGDPGPRSLSQWYEGWLAPDGTFELESSAAYNWGDSWDDSAYAGGGVLSGQLAANGKAIGWMYDATGRKQTWAAGLTDDDGPAGLYVGDDGEMVTSIVVLNEHLALGVTRVRDAGTRVAVTTPTQIPATGNFTVTTRDQAVAVQVVNQPISLVDLGIVEPRIRIPTPTDIRDPSPELPSRIPAMRNTLQIKFREGLTVRLPRGARQPVEVNRRALVSREATALLAEVQNGTWLRSHIADERTIDSLRTNGERRTGGRLPDLNLYFNLVLPDGLNPRENVLKWRRLPEVEWAWIMPDYYLADAPDYAQSQGQNPANNKDLPYQQYLDAAPVGVDARYAWLWNADSQFRGDGTGIKVVDIETSFNPNHVDLPDVTLGLNFDTTAEADSVNHGTSTLGVIAGLNDGQGVTGIAHGAEVGFVTRSTFAGPAGVTFALIGAVGLDGMVLFSVTGNAMEAGDVIVLEQQMAGPNYTEGSNTQLGLVAVEWYKPNFDAIRVATANGIVVVEAAGNGSQNFDAAAYSNDLDAYHQPFLMSGTDRVNDSQAIIVGAGASGADWTLAGTTTAHTRLNFSNYGGRVDLHAWGDAVVTSGYSDGLPTSALFTADGSDAVYWAHYAGTSSATAIMGGVVTAYQGFFRYWTGGTPLSSASMRGLLAYTGTPQVQVGSAAQNIGPMPDLRAAIELFSLSGEQGDAPDQELVQIGCELPPIYTPSQNGDCVTGLPAPYWSLPSGVYAAEALHFVRPVWPDPRPVSSLIQYTLDGSDPAYPASCLANSPCTRHWVPVLTDPHCVSIAGILPEVQDFTEPLICKARMLHNAGFCSSDAFSPVVTEVYVPPGYIKLPEFDKPSSYDSTLSIGMRTGYTSDYPDGGAFVAYTLDGSTPVYYQNSADGISSPIWTDYADDDGFTIAIFNDDEQEVVTLKARNYLLIGGVYVPGEVVQWNFPRLD